MFTNNLFNQQELIESHRQLRPDCSPYAFMDATHLFEDVSQSTCLLKAWNWIRGRQLAALWDLDEVKAQVKVTNIHYCGTREVDLSKIRGTDGRVRDFDAEFRPLDHRVEQRWVSVATALFEGLGLPAVELVKVGEIYFVLDGHHRVSVARAMHKHEIDAVVTEWEVSGCLPWEESGCDLASEPVLAA